MYMYTRLCMYPYIICEIIHMIRNDIHRHIRASRFPKACEVPDGGGEGPYIRPTVAPDCPRGPVGVSQAAEKRDP